MRKGLTALVAALVVPSGTEAAPPLVTAVFPQGRATAHEFRRIQAAGATAVRLSLPWALVAPTRPATPADPSDPAYDWKQTDRAVELARARGLRSLLTVFSAPAWAGGRGPSPRQFGLFARAAARRYSGAYLGLPRVRDWLCWNEPNLSKYLAPQRSAGRLAGADRYRRLVKFFGRAVHAVHRDNVVVAGLVSPFTYRHDPGPLAFMRAFLSVPVKFDAWAVHPYTSGGPTHHAYSRNDVSLGDLPEVRALLRAHRVRAKLWVTEFSWDSKPPDRAGVPARLEGRWVAEALYRGWGAGVSLFTWFSLRDEPRPSPFQSGLFFRRWRPKPALHAFRFPFVAFHHLGRIALWGRTPASDRRNVVIERSDGLGWDRLGVLRAGRHGIFSGSILGPSDRSWRVRARLAGMPIASLTFALKRPRDRFVEPFGT